MTDPRVHAFALRVIQVVSRGASLNKDNAVEIGARALAAVNERHESDHKL